MKQKNGVGYQALTGIIQRALAGLTAACEV
jgi:hypothetical protein